MPNVTIISGSPSETSRLQGVLGRTSHILKEQGLEVNWVNVRELPPEDLVYTKFDSPSMKEANRKVEQADAVIVATPIYKASYTGVLKAFLDLIPQKGLEGKTILPIAIGGTVAHLLAIDYALKPVLSALGARNQWNGIYALDTQVKRNESNEFELAEELSTRIEQTVQDYAQEVKLREQWQANKGEHLA
jgi:FMN reductase